METLTGGPAVRTERQQPAGRRVVGFLLWIVLPVAAAAQGSHHERLPHNIPVFCDGGTVVGSRQLLTLDRQQIPCLRVERGGRVVLANQADVMIGTLQVMEGGVFEGASEGMAARITIMNRSTDPRSDPEQYGTGILIFGAFRLKGSAKTPFVRLAAEPLAGATILTLISAPSGWVVGDRVFLPDSRQLPEAGWFTQSYPLQHETRTIAAINGATITLDAPLSFAHRGARDANGTPTVLSDGTKLLPHVANLTRSITVRSENPNGTRGHLLATHRADVQIENVSFQDMGRTKAIPLDSTVMVDGKATAIGTNQIGRYPLHIHMLMGPVNPTNTGYQFTVRGNVLENSEKWPVAIHGSHYGLIEDNVIVGGPRLTGAGISLEDGSETDNLIRRNFVGDIRGHVSPRETRPNTANGSTPGSGGECIWGAGFNNRFVENVVAGCRNSGQDIVAGVGFKFVTLADPYTVTTPTARGADLNDPAQRVMVDPKYRPIIQFEGNEAYGLMADGLTVWQLGTNGYDDWNTNQAESLVKDFRVWNTWEGAIWLYPSSKVTVDGLVYRYDYALRASFFDASAITGGDYRMVNFTIRNSDVHATAFWRGHDPVGTFTFTNNRITSHAHAFEFRTPVTPGTQARSVGVGTTPVAFTLSGNVVTPWPGQPLRTIEMVHDISRTPFDTASPYVVEVSDHQGVVGDSFRVHFGVQATEDVYGGTKPCAGTRPDVVGLVCVMRSIR